MNLTDKAAEFRLAAQRKPYATPRLVCYGSVKELIQGGGGSVGDAGAHTKPLCWVAEALYGVYAPRTTLLRAWLSQEYVQKGRWWLFAALYRRCGRTVANSIHRGRLPRRWLRPLFDFLVDRAFDESARAIKAAGR
jgi:hypothetical protein